MLESEELALVGRFGRGATRPLASGPGEVERGAGKLWAGRPIPACLLTGGLFPGPGPRCSRRGLLSWREGRGKGRGGGGRALIEGVK